MKKIITTLAFTVISTLMALAQTGADGLVGVWYDAEKAGKITIARTGETFTGKITWLKEPNENGKPKTDPLNPDPKLRSRPRLGMPILTGFKYAGNNEWTDGKIYDARSGKTYSCKISKKSPDKLDVRGYVGAPMFGRTTVFTRAE